MAFTFSAEQREQLLAALERSDSGAWHLTEDVELAIDAYDRSLLSTAAASGTEAPSSAFDALLAHIAGVRAELYELPERMRQQSAFGAVADTDATEVARSAHAAGVALEQLSAKLVVMTSPHPAANAGPYALAEHFIHALGQAFRNRLNIKPTSDETGLFRRFLEAVIELVRRRHADLDELCRVLTATRLAQILQL